MHRAEYMTVYRRVRVRACRVYCVEVPLYTLQNIPVPLYVVIALIRKAFLSVPVIYKGGYDPPVSGIKGHQLRMLQASPDRAYGARVQSNYRLEENRRKN